MTYALKLVTAPTGYPVTLQEVKAQARIDHNEEDQLLKLYIGTATDKAEFLTNTKLLTQTWDWFMDEFPSGDLRVPLAPLVTLDSIEYYDTNNVLQTWASTNYELDVAGIRPRIVRAYNVDWPETYERINAVQIRLTVGYGAAAAVPYAVRQWITAFVTESNEARKLSVDRNVETLSKFMNGLLDPYTVPPCE